MLWCGVLCCGHSKWIRMCVNVLYVCGNGVVLDGRPTNAFFIASWHIVLQCTRIVSQLQNANVLGASETGFDVYICTDIQAWV